MFVKQELSEVYQGSFIKLFTRKQFYDLEDPLEILLLCYLIDTEPIVRDHCKDPGFKDYLRYSDSFIQEGLGVKFTNQLINKALTTLEEHHYLKTHISKVAGMKCRYIKLNLEEIVNTLVPGSYDTDEDGCL